jgi:hypothetical protein
VTTRRRNALLLALVVGLALGGFLATNTGPARGPLDAVPEGSFLVVHVDVAGLSASPLGSELGALGDLGLVDVREKCGLDPLAHVREVAVVVPEDTDDYGVAARTDLSPEALGECARKLADARGVTGHAVKHGSFTVLEPEGRGALASGRLAMQGGGLVLVGRGPWLDRMMDAADHGGPGGKDPHAGLRKAVAPDGKSTAVGTALLPASLRDRLKREMAAESPGDASNVAMEGVLDVSEVGLAVFAGTKGGRARFAAELRCGSEAGCSEVARLVERKRAGWAKDLRVRFLGAGPLVQALRVEARGAKVFVSAEVGADELAGIAGRLLEAARPSGGRVTPSRTGAPPLDAGVERIVAPREAGP